MKASTLVLVLGAFLAFTVPSFADKIDDLVREEMRKRDIPGCVIGILHRGKEIKIGEYGFANVELKVPVTRNSAFEAGAITTQFTAAAILLLVQDGRIALDDPIVKYLKGAPAVWEPLKIRHLLANTSGVKSITGEKGFELSKRLTQAQFIEQVGAWPLEFQPGEKSVYSVTAYILLGHIVENVTGRDFWEFLASRIFQPAGMTASGDREPRNILLNRASGYEKAAGGMVNRNPDLTDMFSAGALVTTLGDLFKWDAALDSEKILSNASKDLMFTKAKLNNGQFTAHGLGCRVDTYETFKLVSNMGNTAGFSTTYDRYPDLGLCIVVLANNSELRGSSSIARAIASFYFNGK
jgi:D-alanyl-D-alanine carboxypeptidase